MSIKHPAPLVALLACLALPPAHAAERREFLADHVEILVRVSNISNVVDAVKSSSVGRLWQDQLFSDFLGNPSFEDALRTTICEDDDKEAGHLKWTEFKMLKGEFLLGLRADTDEPLLVAAISPEDYRRSLEMDRRIHELTETTPFARRTIEFQGVELVGTRGVDGDESWQTCIDDTLLFASNREWIEKSIVRARRDPISEPAADEQPRIGVDVLVADLARAICRQIAEDNRDQQNTGITPFSPLPMLGSAGITSIDKLSAEAVLGKRELSIDIRMAVRDPNRGVLSVLDTRPSSLNLRVPFVPSSAYRYEVTRLDLASLWRAVPGIIVNGPPDSAASFQAGIAAANMWLGIDIERDLLSHLDTQIVAYETIEGSRPATLNTFRVKNEEALRTAIATVFAETGNLRVGMQDTLRIDKVAGTDVYTLKTLEDAQAVSLALSGGFLLLGAESAVDNAVRTLAKPEIADESFYASRLFHELRDLTPTRAFGYSIANWPALMKASVHSAQQPRVLRALTDVIEQRQAGPDGGLLSQVDTAKLPSASHIASFFGPAFGYSEWDGQAIHSRLVIRYQSER